MVSRRPFYIAVIVLYVLGIALMLYRHIAFEVPWLPGELRSVWSLEAKVEFDADGGPATVSLAIPGTQNGYTLIDQAAASPGYGLTFGTKDNVNRAIWTIREARGHQELYYRADMLSDPYAKVVLTPPEVVKPLFKEAVETAMRQLLDEAKAQSADPFSLTQAILRQLQDKQLNVELLKEHKTPAQLVVDLLGMSNVPARVVRALTLEDGRRRQSLTNYVQVFSADGNHYRLFSVEAKPSGANPLMMWEYQSAPLLDVTGGSNSRVTFSIIKKQVSVARALSDKFQNTELLNLSVDALPLEEQALFKGILLLPIGVMVVVFLRVIVGLKTSGTFMPVLIAVAFIQTNLTVGLLGFLSIVGVGLVIRSYLSRLNLLLVARISAVIITVIGIIGILSFITYKLGLTQGMKITFFPMIILSWTIERMSILWEEEGPKEVVKQGGGSLLVAVLAYLAMDNSIIQHLTFNFLGLQLMLMATVLLMGNYTGYRLSELKRFKPLVDELKK